MPSTTDEEPPMRGWTRDFSASMLSSW
jgi:hypothetical protein